jgi:hypothetical protein
MGGEEDDADLRKEHDLWQPLITPPLAPSTVQVAVRLQFLIFIVILIPHPDWPPAVTERDQE